MKKKLHAVLLVSLCVLFLYAVLGNFKFTWIGWSGNEVKAGPPGAQKSDREVTLADYGFEDGMPVPKENPPFRAGRFGYSIIIVSPTVIRVVAEPVYGGGIMLPSAEDFARALDRIDRKRLIKLAVPVTSTIGSERARYQEEGAEKEPGWTKERDGLSRTNELIVVVDDPRNPEKR